MPNKPKKLPKTLICKTYIFYFFGKKLCFVLLTYIFASRINTMHSGKRLKEVLKSVGLRPTQLAEEIGVTYNNILYYTHLEEFSRVIMFNLDEPLTKRGINMKYFLDEDEPMLLKDTASDLQKIHNTLKEIKKILQDHFQIPKD